MLEEINSKDLQKLILFKTKKNNINDVDIEDIKKINSISFFGKIMNGEKSDINIEDVKLFPNLEKISFSDMQINQRAIEDLMNLKKLKQIEFIRCDFENIRFPDNLDDDFKLRIIGCKKIPFKYPAIKDIVIIGSYIDFNNIDFSKAENITILESIIFNSNKFKQFEKMQYINLDGSDLFDENGEKVKDIKINKNINYSHSEKLVVYNNDER